MRTEKRLTIEDFYPPAPKAHRSGGNNFRFTKFRYEVHELIYAEGE